MIRKAETKDLAILAELACQFWPDHTAEEMRAEQLLKEQEHIKNEFQVRYGESAISDIDLLPDM